MNSSIGSDGSVLVLLLYFHFIMCFGARRRVFYPCCDDKKGGIHHLPLQRKGLGLLGEPPQSFTIITSTRVITTTTTPTTLVVVHQKKKIEWRSFRGGSPQPFRVLAAARHLSWQQEFHNDHFLQTGGCRKKIKKNWNILAYPYILNLNVCYRFKMDLSKKGGRKLNHPTKPPPQDRNLEVGKICVRKQLRGTKALASFIPIGRGLGDVRVVSLCSLPDAVIGFYKKLGFKAFEHVQQQQPIEEEAPL